MPTPGFKCLLREIYVTREVQADPCFQGSAADGLRTEPACGCVQELALGNNGIGDRGMEDLSRALVRARRLSRVGLGRNRAATMRTSPVVQAALARSPYMRLLVAPAAWREAERPAGLRFARIFE